MRLFYIFQKIKYFPFLILLMLISIFAVPGYTKGVGEFFSSKAQVTWDDGVPNAIDERAYVFLTDQQSTLKYLDAGHPALTSYGCRINNPGSNYLINPGLDTPYAKGWYKIIDNSDIRELPMTNLYWGAATVTWDDAEDYEKNCEYEYVYLPGSAGPTENQNAAVKGDIYSKGQIVGQKDPAIEGDDYIAIVDDDTLIESAGDITRFTQVKGKQVGAYTLSPTSTSEKSILDKFKTKLKGFIYEYYNVRYDQTSPNNSLNKFSKSNIESGPLNDVTKLAKNPDGDVYVIEGDLTIDELVTLPENAQKLVYVKGNLNIKADITDLSDSAILAFVAEGDITVDGDTITKKDVENLQAGLISLGGTITFNHADNTCTPNPSNPCRQLSIDKGLVIGGYVKFNRDPAKIAFSESERRAGVYIKYNPNIAKLPAFSQLLSAPSIDEASP